MTMSNSEIVREFARGATTGKANSMEIKERGTLTLLVGYDWAVYAARTPDGTVTLFDGWMGYSQTTSTHVNKVRQYADKTTDARPHLGKSLKAPQTDALDALTA